MKQEVIIDNTWGANDISPYFAGHEQCPSANVFGPFIRESYLIHYCLSGCGMLYDKYGKHKIKAGELFVIRPGEITTYVADSDDPWHYVWIGFSGKRAEIFLNEQSVYPCDRAVFQRLCDFIDLEEKSCDIYTSLIYEIIYELFFGVKQGQNKLSNIRRYIKYNYMKNITAKSICELFGYERTYLYRVFKALYGVGVKEYIIKVRMEHARDFLLAGNSVCKTATMTGYNDEFNFSKAYKKYYGYSPSHTSKSTVLK